MAATSSSKNVDKEFNATVLNEDGFGIYWDKKGQRNEIKRFTWKNRNKIEVQVINYGARIVSIKFPDRKGLVEDIVLGFDDIAGYVYYQPHYFGATIGRLSQLVPYGIINLDGEERELSKNFGKHHLNGGETGFDQIVWDTYVSGTKVVMSHISPNFSEGYPGDMFVRVTFELSDMNEFKIDMEAYTTQPTLVNLSNLMYFNLAGHNSGADELYKHIVTVNADCFLKQDRGALTGDVINVANFPFDFQVPKVLGKFMGISPNDGFKEFLCVNKGTNQDNCFIGRAVHNPSGRVLEVYSNQRCLCFTTGNEFGFGRVLPMQQLMKTPDTVITSENQRKSANDVADKYLDFLIDVHQKLENYLQEDKENNYQDLRNLIAQMGKTNDEKNAPTPCNSPKTNGKIIPSSVSALILTERQKEYLRGLYNVVDGEAEHFCQRLKTTVQDLLHFSIQVNSENFFSNVTQKSETFNDMNSTQSTYNTDLFENLKQKTGLEKNKIPAHYKKRTEIVGKERQMYRMHSGIAFQTQNFPSLHRFKNLPTNVLYPGEGYRHTITYKFWIRAGNPSKWVKKNKNELKKA